MQLMSDARHEQLVKAAEECIDLMNLGAEPSSALRHSKVAFDLNDKEVTLVSHAVNNSKQLAHLQSSEGKDKASPFPLTSDKDVTTGADSEADMDTESKPAEAEQPDATEVKDIVKKDAYEGTWNSGGLYRSGPGPKFDKKSAVADLEAAWGNTHSTTPITYLGNPFDVTNELKLAAETSRTESVYNRDKAGDCLDKIAAAFIVSGGPSFIEFEKAAQAEEVTPALLDIIYEHGPSEIGIKRTQEKHAGDRLYVSPQIHDLLALVKEADAYWQKAADFTAAYDHLTAQIHEEEKKLAGDDFDVEDVAEPVSKAGDFATSLLPSLDPESVGKITHSEPEAKAEPLDLGYKTQQQLQNSKARSRIQNLMQDEYIGQQGLPDVVESYNRAMSVNPDFGDAEIMAFIRQDLASHNAMPLDQLVRAASPARGAHSK